jgi:hypothetical protein
MGNSLYRPMFSSPRQELETIGQLHAPTDLPKVKNTRYTWIGGRVGRKMAEWYWEVQIYYPTGTRTPSPESSNLYPATIPTALSIFHNSLQLIHIQKLLLSLSFLSVINRTKFAKHCSLKQSGYHKAPQARITFRYLVWLRARRQRSAE